MTALKIGLLQHWRNSELFKKKDIKDPTIHSKVINCFSITDVSEWLGLLWRCCDSFFSPTWGILRKLIFFEPLKFGITRRKNWKNASFFVWIFDYFHQSWFSFFFYDSCCGLHTPYSSVSLTHFGDTQEADLFFLPSYFGISKGTSKKKHIFKKNLIIFLRKLIVFKSYQLF